MNSNLDHDLNVLRPLAAHELDSVAGGMIFNEIAAAVGRVARALADAIGDLGKPSFPITFDAGAVLKAGPAIGKLGKK
jgi:hypothetical protein